MEQLNMYFYNIVEIVLESELWRVSVFFGGGGKLMVN